MTQQELTLRNLGQSLDDLANLDPRGYGVCKILYDASRKYTGGPTSMNAARKLAQTVKDVDGEVKWSETLDADGNLVSSAQ